MKKHEKRFSTNIQISCVHKEQRQKCTKRKRIVEIERSKRFNKERKKKQHKHTHTHIQIRFTEIPGNKSDGAHYDVNVKIRAIATCTIDGFLLLLYPTRTEKFGMVNDG